MSQKTPNFEKATKETKSRVLPDVILNAINNWEQNHAGQSEISLLDEESCKLRKLLHDYITEDAINAVAHKYSDLYIQAVKEYMKHNGLKTVPELMAFFEDKSYGAEFFPDFINFVTKYIFNAVSIKQIPKIQFVKSGETFVQYMENPENEDLSYLDKDGILSFHDRDTNTLFFKEDNITDFDSFMTQLSHEISHAIDHIDYTKGVFDNEILYKYAKKLYAIDKKENKNNAEEKTATRIGVVIGKNFTQRLERSLMADNKNFLIMQHVSHQKD